MISRTRGRRDWKMNKKRMSFKKKKHDEKEEDEMIWPKHKHIVGGC